MLIKVSGRSLKKLFIPDMDPGSGSRGLKSTGSQIRIRNTVATGFQQRIQESFPAEVEIKTIPVFVSAGK
jgi:hypothetical protein